MESFINDYLVHCLDNFRTTGHFRCPYLCFDQGFSSIINLCRFLTNLGYSINRFFIEEPGLIIPSETNLSSPELLNLSLAFC